MPIAHGHHHACIEFAPQFGLQRLRLPPGKLQDRRASSDFRIVVPHVRARVLEIRRASGCRAIRAKGKSMMSGSQNRL